MPVILLEVDTAGNAVPELGKVDAALSITAASFGRFATAARDAGVAIDGLGASYRNITTATQGVVVSLGDMGRGFADAAGQADLLAGAMDRAMARQNLYGSSTVDARRKVDALTIAISDLQRVQGRGSLSQIGGMGGFGNVVGGGTVAARTDAQLAADLRRVSVASGIGGGERAAAALGMGGMAFVGWYGVEERRRGQRAIR